MNWLFEGILCLATVLPLSPARQVAMDATNEKADTPKITVLLYDHVHLTEKIREKIQDQVTNIYRKAGVDIEWALCSTGEGEAYLFPGCTGHQDPTHVLLRIHPRVRQGLKSGVVGEANLPARIVNVYWDRIQSQAFSVRVPVLQLSAHSIAHEIGHLLLGPGAHAAAGIMVRRMETRDLTDLVQGSLGFTPQECERIKAAIRMRQASAILAASAPIPED